MLKKIKLITLGAVFSVSASPVFATTAALTTESAAFKTQFLAGAALIGIAYIGAAYGAVIYKWLKAMVFGG